MAKVELLAPIIFKWEGGWSDHKADKGGKTNMGVTLETWRACGYDKDGDGDIDADDLRRATREDVVRILKKHYWDRWKADKINSQALANILVDWVWGSGAWGIKIPQRMLGVKVDGVVGDKTIAALNAQYPDKFFAEVWAERKRFFENIVANNPSQRVFLKGWLNRLNDYKYF